MNAVVVPLRSRSPAVRSTPPRRRANAEVRTREYLTPDEVERLMDAARRTLNRPGFSGGSGA
jgi:hypothetical protein